MKKYKVSFITRSNDAYNGSIKAQIVREANSAQAAMKEVYGEMNPFHKKRYILRAIELL